MVAPQKPQPRRRLPARILRLRLAECDAVEIRRRYAEDSRVTIGMLASYYSVSKYYITCILRGTLWEHAGGPISKTNNHRKGRKSRWHGRKLVAKDAVYIRVRYALGGITMQELADKYHVSKQAVFQVIRREVWKNAEGQQRRGITMQELVDKYHVSTYGPEGT